MKGALTPARAVAALAVLALAVLGLAQLATPFGLEEARRTWRSLEPDERQELVRRYEELKRLPPSQRDELFRRVERLRQVEGELIDELPDDARRKLAGLEARDQRRIVRDMLRSELAARGRRMRDELPEDLVARLEGLPPAERHDVLTAYERELRAETLDRLARALELDEAEVADLRAMTDEEVHRRMLGLRRRVIERQVELRGLPRWVALDVWRDMQSANDQLFNRLWNRELSRHARLRREREAELDDAAASAAPDETGAASGAADRMRLARLVERVRIALRPDPVWHVELAEVPRDERRRTFEERVARRVRRALEALPVDPARTAAVAELRGPQLSEAVRALLRDVAREQGLPARPGRL